MSHSVSSVIIFPVSCLLVRQPNLGMYHSVYSSPAVRPHPYGTARGTDPWLMLTVQTFASVPLSSSAAGCAGEHLLCAQCGHTDVF